jgi:cell division protein FtsW
MFSLVLLTLAGMILVTAASPPVAARIGLDPFYFVVRQQMFLVLALGVMFGISLMDNRNIRRLGTLGLLGSLILLCLLPFLGVEIKGAKRWLSIAGISIQPSEFLKPCFATVIAWVFAERYRTRGFPGFKIGIGIFLLSAALLIIQPDFGMTVTLGGIFAVQLFLAGIPFYMVAVLAILAIGGFYAAYSFLPHVQNRIDDFLNPATGNNYQVNKSLEAFQSGGLLGRGPGEGVVKWSIPDSHTDFIFAVAAEEFGMLIALVLVMVFAFVVIRSFWRIWQTTDLFTLLAVSGIISQFAIQAIINMGVSLNLLPAKGMTLPFLSYGGSSLLAMALAMGMLLGLTRKRYGAMQLGWSRDR